MKLLAWWNEQTFLQKFFVIFLITSAVLWTVVPSTYHSSLHFDPPEALMWGSTFNWGNAKHPPMSGYMLFNFCKLFNFSNFSIFLLSQICVTLGFIYIYKLARCFFERNYSVIATLLITFYFFYNYETPKFNANIPHLLFIPMMSYYFYRGCFADKWHHWILLAISAACACLSKYSAGVVMMTFVLFAFANRDARKIFLRLKPYVAALIFAALMLPHIIHLINTDFTVFNYISSGKQVKYSYIVQLLVQVVAIIVPLLCMSAACCMTYILGERKIPKLKITIVNKKAFQYSACIICGQAAFLLMMGIFGHRLLTIWTFPLYLPAGILIMSFCSYPASDGVKRYFALLCGIFAAIMLMIPLIYYNCRSKFRYHIEKAEFRAAAENFYHERTGKEIPFITGDIWNAAMLQNTFKYTVKAAPSFDMILLGLHWETIENNGALVIAGHPASTAKEIEKFADVKLEWVQKEVEFSARFGKTKKYKFHLAVIPPGTLKKTEIKK